MLRFWLTVFGLTPTFVFAQLQTFDIFYAGSKCGQSVGEMTADGSVTSKMDLKVGPASVVSTFDGKVKEGRLVECTVSTTQDGTTLKVVWKDGKVSVWTGDKQVVADKEYKPYLKAAVSAFHPVVNGLLWNGMGGEPKRGKIVFIDTLAELEIGFSARDNKMATVWSGDFQGTAIEFAFTKEGKPVGVNVPSQKITWQLVGHESIFEDPLAKFPELSQPTFTVKTERRVRMTARDGTRLMADISRPNIEGKFPTVLVRTPYGRAASLGAEEWLAKRGYVVVSQDVRGRGGSDGDFDPLIHERKDGYDTLDWIVSQPWSDGKVGMIGASYLGYVQWAAATTGHPALKCIVPQVSPPQPDKNFPWENGNFMLMGSLWWGRVVKDRTATTANAFADMKNLDSMKRLPLTTVDDKFYGSNLDFFDKWLKRPNLSDWGDVFTSHEVAQVKIPALHISGLWDGDGIGTALHWEARNTGRTQDWLVFGPWTHLFNTSHKFGDQEYGDHGILELEPMYLRFFDTYLKGMNVNMDEQPRVQFFVTGSNQWMQTASWPPPGAMQAMWYLGKGALTKSTTPGKQSYKYDPNRPSFTESEFNIDVTGNTTVVENTNDGMGVYFRTSPMPFDVTLLAPASFELYVSTTVRDASLRVLVLDEDEKGVMRYIGMPGVTRAGYKNGKLSSIKPGEVVKISVQPWWFARRFQKGHRLVALVTSDTYPQFARIPGTGEPDWKAKKLLPATHTIWFGPKYPSKFTAWKLP